jgi:hypothetical protein
MTPRSYKLLIYVSCSDLVSLSGVESRDWLCWSWRNSPQCLHLTAAALIVSAQNGQVVSSLGSSSTQAIVGYRMSGIKGHSFSVVVTLW